MACGVGAVGLGWRCMRAMRARCRRWRCGRRARWPKRDFLAACVRCGLCVRDCPYDILTLATPEQPVANGTPFFVARDKPCEMCVDLPCVKACPTGALDDTLTDVNNSRMGLAVLVDQENCLNFLGLRCDICYRVCPLIDKAITLEQQLNTRTGKHAQFIPVVHSDACTGCGKCEKAARCRWPPSRSIRATGQGRAGPALPARLDREGQGRRQPRRARPSSIATTCPKACAMNRARACRRRTPRRRRPRHRRRSRRARPPRALQGDKL